MASRWRHAATGGGRRRPSSRDGPGPWRGSRRTGRCVRASRSGHARFRVRSRPDRSGCRRGSDRLPGRHSTSTLVLAGATVLTRVGQCLLDDPIGGQRQPARRLRRAVRGSRCRRGGRARCTARRVRAVRRSKVGARARRHLPPGGGPRQRGGVEQVARAAARSVGHRAGHRLARLERRRRTGPAAGRPHAAVTSCSSTCEAQPFPLGRLTDVLLLFGDQHARLPLRRPVADRLAATQGAQHAVGQ